MFRTLQSQSQPRIQNSTVEDLIARAGEPRTIAQRHFLSRAFHGHARARSSSWMLGLLAFALLLSPVFAHAEAGGASSSITGTVADSTGAVIPGATVEIRNPVSHLTRSTITDGSGKFAFPNVPLNPIT